MNSLRAFVWRSIVFVLILGWAACTRSQWKRLDEDEVLRTLPALSLLSASLSEQNIPDSTRQRAYHEFFARRGYTLADWDSTMAWYAKNRVQLFYDFYRLSGDSLTRQRTAMEKRRDLIAATEERRRLWHGAMLDSVDLLRDSSTYYRAGELINKRFELYPISPYDSTTRLQAEILILGLQSFSNDSLDLELRLHLSDSTSAVSHQQIRSSGFYRLEAYVPNGKTALRAIGTLRGTLSFRDSTVVWVSPFKCYKFSSVQSATTHIAEESIYNDVREDWSTDEQGF